MKRSRAYQMLNFLLFRVQIPLVGPHRQKKENRILNMNYIILEWMVVTGAMIFKIPYGLNF